MWLKEPPPTDLGLVQEVTGSNQGGANSGVAYLSTLTLIRRYEIGSGGLLSLASIHRRLACSSRP